jgi:hypothetical protein
MNTSTEITTDITGLTTGTRCGLRVRNALRAAAVSLSLAGSVLAVTGTADAAVVSNGGAAAETVGFCDGNSAILDLSNYGFDYVKVWAYVYGVGWVEGAWNRTFDGSSTVGVPSTRTGWAAFYVQYADWNGYSYDIGGEWVPFGGSYWCWV